MSSTSPYTNPTGDGYAGTHTARHNRVSVTLGSIPDFETGDPIVVLQDGDRRIRVVPGDDPDAHEYPGDVIERRVVNERSQVEFSMATAQALGVDERADVRLYDRDDTPGLVIVRADDDPFLNDGGES